MKPRTLLSGAILAFFSSASIACSCLTSSIEASEKSAETIFLAEVVGAHAEKQGDSSWMIYELSDVIVKRGSKAPITSVKSPLGTDACGTSLLVPEKYWFFTSSELVITKCEPRVLANDPQGMRVNETIWDKVVEQKRAKARAPKQEYLKEKGR